MWFLFTVCTILAWSGSDLFSKMGSKPSDKLSHWKMVIAVGAVMGVHAIWQLTAMGIDYDFINIIKYLPVSALYIISMVFGYAGLRYIELSLSSPICNSSGALVALMCFLFLGQRMSAAQFIAVALICAGILALGILEKRDADRERLSSGIVPDSKYTKSALALVFPVLYCLIDALGTFADAFYLDVVMDATTANISYELTFLFVGILAFIYVVFVKKESLTPSRDKFKFIAALCETAGQFAYVFALSGNAIVAAPVIASYCVFSVVWSRIFLKEKLSKEYYFVIAAVVAGIAVLGFFDA
ncbi:MAG: EamA family transporter [Oscillospiraceae bacterium]